MQKREPEWQHGSLDDKNYKKRETNPYAGPQGPVRFDAEKMLMMLGDMAQYIGDMMNSDSNSDGPSSMNMTMNMGMGDNSNEDDNMDVGGGCKYVSLPLLFVFCANRLQFYCRRSSAKFGRRWCSSTIH